ncbi:beta-N-acetylhexosaminidase [Alteromonas sp. CYL-A6]|uniref:beta-N-acetylhexosaminidase n=1 Tax=Alteromonas nitratireducens TaxID=3390813 RepID=UPI0034C0B7C9
MGPLIIDCQQELLQPDEKEKLAHPLTGGVILFARNYHDPEQLRELTRSIREAAGKPLLIAVDHEGGRVQRFREGFTRLPAMGDLLTRTADSDEASALANACGTIMAYELKQADIDISFAPVLDINGISDVIGDRAFADNADEVVTLARALINGMRQCDMPATGKHFPGHGSVQADSHIAVPVDSRALSEITSQDMIVFERLIAEQALDAIMPAHVIFPAVDDAPAGFSSVWLQTILRQQMGFDGVIFSDDLSMEGAAVAGGYPERAQAALAAGCTMLLACNNPAGAERILDTLPHTGYDSTRCQRMTGRALPADAAAAYQKAIALRRRYD